MKSAGNNSAGCQHFDINGLAQTPVYEQRYIHVSATLRMAWTELLRLTNSDYRKIIDIKNVDVYNNSNR